MDLNKQVSPILWHNRIQKHLDWQIGINHDGRLKIQGDLIENLELIQLQLDQIEWKGLRIDKLDLIRCDFSNLNFSLSVAIKSRFTNCKLSTSNLQACDLSGTKLIQSKLNACDLSQANLSYAVIEESIWTECILDSCTLHGSDLRDVQFTNCNGFSLNGSDSYAAGSNFKNCNFNQSDWSQFIGWESTWNKIQLNKANFFGADLRHSIFRGCQIQETNFEYCQIDKDWLNRHRSIKDLWDLRNYTDSDPIPLALDRNLQERYRAISKREGQVFYLRRRTK